MSKSTPFLEARPTGFYWRRRVPAAILPRYQTPFFCFPLKTHVLREAAAVASRITAISDICFRAEIDVSPEVMTRLLVTYARLEIEASDRLRALTGPRTREAAEAGLAMETAIRASLRDAIFLCERDPAFRAIESTARHLGLDIEGNDEDLPILADKMLRLMLELSEERERRARGHFSDSQPYLSLALSGAGLACGSMMTAPVEATRAPEIRSTGMAEVVPTPVFASARAKCVDKVDAMEDAPPAPSKAPDTSAETEMPSAAVPPTPELEPAPPSVVFDNGVVSIAFAKETTPADPGSREPSVVELFDIWFDYKARGCLKTGEYEITDATLAEAFLKNSDTDKSTRKIIANFFGDRCVSDLTKADCQGFLNFLRTIPTNHGKSPRLRHLPLADIIKQADEHDKALIASAQKAADEKNRKAGKKPVKLKRSDIKGLTPRLTGRTVQRHQGTLASVLDHAVEIGLIPSHDFRGFVLKDKTVALLKAAGPDTSRLLWGSEFGDLLATKKWNSPKTRIDDEGYWAPLIARLHGMRSEEILQLHVANIRILDGVAFFDIVQGTGQSLKSNNARRMVPIHSQLLELGFMELIEYQRRNGEKRLFPRATRSQTAKLSYSANFTKRFANYRKTNGVYNERMDFHALRTTFNSDAVAARMPDTARRYIMGHQNPDVGITNYLPEGFPLATLKELIEHRQYDLSMVTRRFAKVDQRPKGPVLAISNDLPRASSKGRKAAS